MHARKRTDGVEHVVLCLECWQSRDARVRQWKAAAITPLQCMTMHTQVVSFISWGILVLALAVLIALVTVK